MYNLHLGDIWVSDVGFEYHKGVVNYKAPEMPGYIQPEVVTPSEIKTYTETDVKLETKSFIGKWLAKLDFNNLTYYPSKFQPYTFPSVINIDDNIVYVNGIAYDNTIKVDISLGGNSSGVSNQTGDQSSTVLSPNSTTFVPSVAPVTPTISIPSVAPVTPTISMPSLAPVTLTD